MAAAAAEVKKGKSTAAAAPQATPALIQWLRWRSGGRNEDVVTAVGWVWQIQEELSTAEEEGTCCSSLIEVPAEKMKRGNEE